MTPEQLRDCQRAATRIGCDLETYLSHRDAGERHCARCGWQPSTAFGSSNWCRSCAATYRTARRRGEPRHRSYRREAPQLSATDADIEAQKARLHAWIATARKPIGRF